MADSGAKSGLRGILEGIKGGLAAVREDDAATTLLDDRAVG